MSGRVQGDRKGEGWDGIFERRAIQAEHIMYIVKYSRMIN